MTTSLETLASALALWASIQTGLPIPADEPPHPRIVFQRNMKAVDVELGLAPGTIYAYFNSKNETIYLPSGWRQSSLKDQSYLVHELVHWLQVVNGRFHHGADLEGPAYRAQAQYICQRGGRAENFGMTLGFFNVATGGTFGPRLCPGKEPKYAPPPLGFVVPAKPERD